MSASGEKPARQLIDLCFAPERASACVDAGEWEGLLALAVVHGVAPLIWLRTCAGRVEPPIPPAPLRLLEHLYRANCLRNLRLAAEQSWLAAALEKAGIRAWTLKGPALSERLYGDGGIRQVADLDLLVEPASLARADALLARLGYERQARGELAAQAATQELVYVRGSESAPPVFLDLHQRLLPYVRRDPLATRVYEQGMTRENLLLYLCATQISHRFSRLRYLCDVASFLIREGGATDWDEFLRGARQLPFGPGIALSLRWACDAAGCHVPEPIVQALAPGRLGGAVLRRALGRNAVETVARGRALGGPAGASVILGAAGGMRARMTMAWSMVFPSGAYLREQGGAARGGGRLAPIYAGRLARNFPAALRHLLRPSS